MAWATNTLFPGYGLNETQMLHLKLSHFDFLTPNFTSIQPGPALRLAFIMTMVILLEGCINLNIIQKLDAQRRPIHYKRELRLIGVANLFLGSISALPVMPILVRSTANIAFGAQTRASGILQGLWLLLTVSLHQLFQFIPMAAVAALLTLVGFALINPKEVRILFQKGKNQWLPFLLTLVVILAVDLLWGVFAGLLMGIFFSVKSSMYRTMVLVEDKGVYLLKFFKDVTFIHKSELKDHLDQIPNHSKVIIDGAGNIAVDQDIEEWLLDYQSESLQNSRTVEFNKSKLALSSLFKESS